MADAASGADAGQGETTAGSAGSGGAPIVLRDSVFKLLALASPCIAVTAISLYGAAGGLAELGGNTSTQLALAAIGGLTALVLLRMAFDRRPVLIIDENGITCRRPDTGTIPWRAVAGLGITKSIMLRKVLLIAVDEAELDDKAQVHAKERTGLMSILSPQVARFQGQLAGHPMISIPVAYLSISTRGLRDQINEKIHFHG
tara:strand:- start:1280 stop:1882 length:603 start_codon:yes stop_codon:yes gene_type:complete